MTKKVESSNLPAGKAGLKVQSKNENKSVTVRLNGVRISAQKLNLMAKVLRGRDLAEGLRITAFAKTKAARIIRKLLMSGRASALLLGLAEKKLTIFSLLTNQGPSLKRGRPVARGTYHPIIKKSAHLVLTLKEVTNGSKD